MLKKLSSGVPKKAQKRAVFLKKKKRQGRTSIFMAIPAFSYYITSTDLCNRECVNQADYYQPLARQRGWRASS
jgi:hypothetical protein